MRPGRAAEILTTICSDSPANWVSSGSACSCGFSAQPPHGSGRRFGAADDPLLAGLAAGLVAFLITSMVSNPLMLREVSYVFWIALGLAVGRSATVQSSSIATDVQSLRRSPTSGALVHVTTGGDVVDGELCFSSPFRFARSRNSPRGSDPRELRSLGLGDGE